MNNYFKTKNRLQVAIDNADKIDGFQDMLDMHFASLMFDEDGEDAEKALNGELFEPAYWMLEGSIDHGINGTMEYDNEDIRCEYVTGYYWTLKQGDIIEKDGIKYTFLTTLSLPEEMEHQAKDGKCVYDYRGPSFVAIYMPIVTETILETILPSGSGIDCDWSFEEKKNNILCRNSFHCMNHTGMYDGYADFTVIVPRNNPVAFKLQFNGSEAQYKNRRYALREYLEDTLHECLNKLEKED